MAYNQSDALFEQSTDTNGNFANSQSGQTNAFFMPKVYSKKVLNFFRKASVAEAITNTDYSGEISAFGDTVRIVKEPTITVYQYERGADVTKTKLTDVEETLTVDVAKLRPLSLTTVALPFPSVSNAMVPSTARVPMLISPLLASVITSIKYIEDYT